MLEGLTTPCTGIGAWEGAAVIIGPTLASYTGRRGLVSHSIDHGSWRVILPPTDDMPEAVVPINEAGLSLDLTHQPTRLTATARLAAHQLPSEEGGVTWRHVPDITRLHAPEGRRRWVLASASGRRVYSPLDVPALADLDPDDDTRLDDGARVVDARALVIVCRQVWS